MIISMSDLKFFIYRYPEVKRILSTDNQNHIVTVDLHVLPHVDIPEFHEKLLSEITDIVPINVNIKLNINYEG